MTEKFPNQANEIDTKVLETKTVPNKMNLKRSTPRHILMKMQKVKDKERILKAAS